MLQDNRVTGILERGERGARPGSKGRLESVRHRATSVLLPSSYSVTSRWSVLRVTASNLSDPTAFGCRDGHHSRLERSLVLYATESAPPRGAADPRNIPANHVLFGTLIWFQYLIRGKIVGWVQPKREKASPRHVVVLLGPAGELLLEIQRSNWLPRYNVSAVGWRQRPGARAAGRPGARAAARRGAPARRRSGLFSSEEI